MAVRHGAVMNVEISNDMGAIIKYLHFLDDNEEENYLIPIQQLSMFALRTIRCQLTYKYSNYGKQMKP